MSDVRHPAAAVSVVIREPRSGAFLLARRARPPAQDLWAFPGGRVHWGETIRQAAARELAEETALTVDPDSLAVAEVVDLIGDENHGGAPEHHFVLTVFVGTATGTPVAGDDAAELRFATIADMDGLAMTQTTLETARRLAGV
ncbi:MAG: NUDIX domain-containing protein [Roseitalea sp.]|jgi:ADP-ribose pyrophosphatase YjhB (NUDIX family)|nr:NUDIX domain-containing protein [Roseitalea sp.]MBO6722976.1 NUDIX domain-containing protein [Roseitalea sp.]MBO6744109.1 NUDIX domain-containing protein [Roseitalea sp.]